MTPEIKQTADEIVEKFRNSEILKDLGGKDYFIAIEDAIKAVELIIEEYKGFAPIQEIEDTVESLISYWNEVKTELKSRI